MSTSKVDDDPLLVDRLSSIKNTLRHEITPHSESCFDLHNASPSPHNLTITSNNTPSSLINDLEQKLGNINTSPRANVPIEMDSQVSNCIVEDEQIQKLKRMFPKDLSFNSNKLDHTTNVTDVCLDRISDDLDQIEKASVKNLPKNKIKVLKKYTPPNSTSHNNDKSNDFSFKSDSPNLKNQRPKKVKIKPQLFFLDQVDNFSQSPFSHKLKYKPHSFAYVSKNSPAKKSLTDETSSFNINNAKIINDLLDECMLFNNKRLQKSLNLHKPPSFDNENNLIFEKHPYAQEIKMYQPPERVYSKKSTQANYKPIRIDGIELINTEEEFDKMILTLLNLPTTNGEGDIAIDLEHHDFHSYHGFTCLVQISSRSIDYIIDALLVRSFMYKLNLITTDPKRVKVMHGSQNDIVWLQKDFGIYIVGLFDTNEAARPLPVEMVEYASSDTHFLLFIFDCLTNILMGYDEPPKIEVEEKSRDRGENGNQVEKVEDFKPAEPEQQFKQLPEQVQEESGYGRARSSFRETVFVARLRS
ncbi:Exosome component 10 [Smittium culicis]|uniref:Exosome component 10 n=1 Tax=Smittium culicis TaxID=133412 RepID=A0A1R1Y554_9FUNG|nr:Exosome component 10 [Smittium culicis]